MDASVPTIHIVCCDYNLALLHCTVSMLEKQIERYVPIDGITFTVKGYLSPQELLQREEPIDILVLDVEIPGINGLQLAKKLRQTQAGMLLIIYTQRSQYLQEAFEVNTFRYVFKSEGDGALWNKVEQALAEKLKNTCSKRVLVPCFNEKTERYIKTNTILFVKSMGAHSALYLNTQPIETRLPLRKWQENLGSNFYRCHESYLINLFQVWSVPQDFSKAEFQNGESVPVAFRRRREFEKLLNDSDNRSID